MSETEQRYSQIKKEALAIVWACEKFADYILGKSVRLDTDHKPLVPYSVQFTWIKCHHGFRLRLTRFDYPIEHVPGKLLYIADALSRAPNTSETLPPEYPDTEFFVYALVATLPANADRLESY